MDGSAVDTEPQATFSPKRCCISYLSYCDDNMVNCDDVSAIEEAWRVLAQHELDLLSAHIEKVGLYQFIRLLRAFVDIALTCH